MTKEYLLKTYQGYNLYRTTFDEECQFIDYLKMLRYSEQEAKDMIRDLCLICNLPNMAKLPMVE